MLAVSLSMEGLDLANERVAALVRLYLPLVAQKAGAQTVAYLRSLTDEMRPPAKSKEGARRAHPGHWADITGLLANGYQWDVTATADGAELRLTNAVEYAEHVERHDGMFVLTGVDAPGGVVDKFITETWDQVRPVIERKSQQPSSGA